MFGITDLATYLIGTIFIVLLPGPNSLYVLSVAAGRGVKAGYQGAAGVFVGDTVLMVLSATGMAAMLKVYPALFWGLKAAGAAYLGWVGSTCCCRPGAAGGLPVAQCGRRRPSCRRPRSASAIHSARP